jgi:iron-sulfur cluster repair protein YtfE (RIC family)
MSYEKLIAEHAQIDRALERLQVLIACRAPDVPSVVIALSLLADELTHHLAHEDSFIYPRMTGGDNPESAAIAEAFVAEFSELTHDWQLYLGEWNSECIAEDWAHFRHDTEKMIARLAHRVRAENELLYTVALKTSAIPLRRAA